MAILLGCDSVHLEYPTKLVLGDVTLGVFEGDRVGIVGRNGDGKSSLLRVLAGVQEPDAGRVTRTRGVEVGLLGQRDQLSDDETVHHAVGSSPMSPGKGSWASFRAASADGWTWPGSSWALGTCSRSTSRPTIWTCGPLTGLPTT